MIYIDFIFMRTIHFGQRATRFLSAKRVREEN